MDPELRIRLFETLDSVRRQRQLNLTPYGVLLLTAIVESIGDRTSERVRVSIPLQQAQFVAIDAIPRALELTSKVYQTRLIDGLMLLTLMPRLMEGFCPPFESPPSY